MRHKATITIEDQKSRDFGKTFILTEMPADQAERFCTQARLLILEARGLAVPDDEAGAAALARTGIDMANIREMKALQDPSLDTLWDYVKYQHRAGAPLQAIVNGENSQIEEISTRTRLRWEVLKLNLGFSQGAEPSSSG